MVTDAAVAIVQVQELTWAVWRLQTQDSDGVCGDGRAGGWVGWWSWRQTGTERHLSTGRQQCHVRWLRWGGVSCVQQRRIGFHQSAALHAMYVNVTAVLLLFFALSSFWLLRTEVVRLHMTRLSIGLWIMSNLCWGSRWRPSFLSVIISLNVFTDVANQRQQFALTLHHVRECLQQELLESIVMIGTLTVDGPAVTFGTSEKPFLPNVSINAVKSQCTKFIVTR